MTWLSNEFGIGRLKDTPLVLPTDEFFPEPYAATVEGVRRLMDRVCGFMEVDSRRVGLDFYTQHESISFNTGLIDARTGAAGVYDESSGRITIWLETSTLSDASNVVANNS